MENCTMVGTCECCKKKDVSLRRITRDYPGIKCECHSPNHFDLAFVCADCEKLGDKAFGNIETKISLKIDTARKVSDLIEATKELLKTN